MRLWNCLDSPLTGFSSDLFGYTGAGSQKRRIQGDVGEKKRFFLIISHYPIDTKVKARINGYRDTVAGERAGAPEPAAGGGFSSSLFLVDFLLLPYAVVFYVLLGDCGLVPDFPFCCIQCDPENGHGNFNRPFRNNKSGPTSVVAR
jgi:hypothetical protein